MRTRLFGFLIGCGAAVTAGVVAQGGRIPPRLTEEVRRLVAEIVGAGSTESVIRARDQLALIGTVAEPEVIRQFRPAGQQARWGLIQTLALTGGKEARRYQVRSLQSRLLRGKTGCLCIHALGIRHPDGEVALLNLVRGQDPGRAAWLRLCAFLGLSTLPPSASIRRFTLAPVQVQRYLPQERAAWLLLLCRHGRKEEAQVLAPEIWPEGARTWSDRLIRRACVLALARFPMPSWRNRVVAWMKEESCRDEDHWACGLALGALGLELDLPVVQLTRARPRAWAGFLSRAATGKRRQAVAAAALARLRTVGERGRLHGTFAGIYARALADDKLTRIAATSAGTEVERDVLRLELARRILSDWSQGRGAVWVQQAANRTWNDRTRADRLLIAALAVGSGKPIRPERKAVGPGLMAKALRGEIPAATLLDRITAALRRRGANAGWGLDAEEGRLGRTLVLGHSLYFRRRHPVFAPTTGQEVTVPKGAPSVESFYEQLEAFLDALPLFLPPQRG